MRKNSLTPLLVALTVLSICGQLAADTSTPTPVLMPRGTVDPDIYVDVHVPDKAWPGTTLLPDNHNLQRPRIIEVNMLGEIVWQYVVPENLRQYTNPGFDVELLPNNNILFVLPRKGIYEINRDGNIVWSHLDKKVSHDADRLPDGNTIFVFGAYDQKDDAQVREINPKGETVWAWYAKDHFYKAPYKDIFLGGWTHTNAVSRLPNGNTLISLRNFDFVVEVDPSGSVVRTIGEGIFHHQHDPELLANGNILVADHSVPQRALEIDPETSEIVWQFAVPGQLLRDANRLPNGNTLITGATVIVEVSPQGEIVWRLRLKAAIEKGEAPARGFYKAERIGILTQTPTPAPAPNQIQLFAGWNLISVPSAQIDPSIGVVFAETPAVTKVHTYREGTWLIANRGAGGWSGTLTQILDGKGYWVYATEAASLTLHPASPDTMASPPSYPFNEGMNMIGYTSSIAIMPVDTYLARVQGKWTSLYRYDATKGWEVAKPGGMGFTQVERGRGYWIYLNAPGTLVPPTSIGTAPITEGSIPIIDAHSQVDQYVELEKVIQLMDQGGVACTILSTRGTVRPEELVSFADNYQGRIIPAVRTKGYMQKEGDEYYKLLKKQVNMHQYGAMAEVLMYHAQKGELAPLIVVQPDDEMVQAALDYALGQKWPFIAHIEFAAAGSLRDVFMTKFEALLVRYPEHPFVLIHMGQLDCDGVRRLIEAHPNIYFITARTTNIVYPYYLPTKMFDGDHLSTDWKQLMIEYPDRFIMGFDMVWARDWGQFYLYEIALWREAIKELPVEVAHAFAHGNAERLWHLQLVR